jgi:endonuclease YncB( thermonuclease family)
MAEQLRIPGTEGMTPEWVIPESERIRPKYVWAFKMLVHLTDGDTFSAMLDNGNRIWSEFPIRLAGINCPESNRRETKAQGAAATLATKEWLATHTNIVVRTLKDPKRQKDSFGRWLAVVRGDDSQGRQCDLAKWLVATGHAAVFMPEILNEE